MLEELLEASYVVSHCSTRHLVNAVVCDTATHEDRKSSLCSRNHAINPAAPTPPALAASPQMPPFSSTRPYLCSHELLVTAHLYYSLKCKSNHLTCSTLMNHNKRCFLHQRMQSKPRALKELLFLNLIPA